MNRPETPLADDESDFNIAGRMTEEEFRTYAATFGPVRIRTGEIRPAEQVGPNVVAGPIHRVVVGGDDETVGAIECDWYGIDPEGDA